MTVKVSNNCLLHDYDALVLAKTVNTHCRLHRGFKSCAKHPAYLHLLVMILYESC